MKNQDKEREFVMQKKCSKCKLRCRNFEMNKRSSKTILTIIETSNFNDKK